MARDSIATWERQSSLYLEGLAAGRAEARAKARAEGRAEGRLEYRREICSIFARKYHPAVSDRAETIIASCDDPDRLMECILSASELSDAEFLKLLGA